MIEIIQSETFKNWLSGLKDLLGNRGDAKPVREGISELRIDYGPGYRVYFIQRGPVMIVLLAGGDKRTQNVDIERAIMLAKDWSAQ